MIMTEHLDTAAQSDTTCQKDPGQLTAHGSLRLPNASLRANEIGDCSRV